MDGVLVIDKPSGLTSHDVVAAARRALGERRIGHTGTLDPMATGVLPLAVGRATRLVRFLTASDKDYDATIRFGVTTDTFDRTGRETGRTDRTPARDAVVAAMRSLTGCYLQAPPPFSAKKVGGTRAYELARKEKPVTLEPASVRVSRCDLLSFSGETAEVALSCSAGFYVRSFVHRVGELVGTGATLEGLRRTRSGDFCVADAVTLDVLVTDFERAAATLVPLRRLLSSLPAVHITSDERRRIAHGQELLRPVADSWVRIVDPEGDLVAVGERGSRPDSLHPAVVLI